MTNLRHLCFALTLVVSATCLHTQTEEITLSAPEQAQDQKNESAIETSSQVSPAEKPKKKSTLAKIVDSVEKIVPAIKQEISKFTEPKTLDKTAFVVNQKVVCQSELDEFTKVNKFLNTYLGAGSLDFKGELIDLLLIQEKGENLKFPADSQSAANVAQALKQLLNQPLYSTDIEFDSFLYKNFGIHLQAIKNIVGLQTYSHRVISYLNKLTPEFDQPSIDKFYQERFPTSIQAYQLQIAVLSDEELILHQNGQFEPKWIDLTHGSSVLTPIDNISSSVLETIKNLQKGQISKPIVFSDGYKLVKVLDWQEGKLPIEKVKERIVQNMRSDELKGYFDRLTKELRSKAAITTGV